MNQEPLIVANWKATKTIKEGLEWIKEAKESLEKVDFAQIVLCPSFVALPITASMFEGTNIKVGSQDVSRFREGAYTGEVSAKMLSGLVSYSIVGHSERRQNFGENDESVVEKVKLLAEIGIKSIVCISQIEQAESLDRVKDKIDTVAYEPLFAIGTGQADSSENAEKMAQKIKSTLGSNIRVIYGGSVDPGNITAFLKEENISGVLPGRASWDSKTFLNLLEAIRVGVID